MSRLFEAMQMGALSLANRVVMAPMTRSRADGEAQPNDLMVEYYRQRAGAGLIVTEGTSPSPDGIGYCRTPGIYSAGQIAGWRRVTDAVHAAGGKIVLQLMHCGRIASRHNKPAGAENIAPSAVKAAGKIFTDAAGMAEHDPPRALDLAGIAAVVAEFRQAARNAREAGFDGVELHCTSGYLPMQFLAVNTNLRTDVYGGSPANRARFVIEVIEALAAEVGADRVGMRICPGNPFNDVLDPNPAETYGALFDGIAHLPLAYLHVVRSPLPYFDAFAFARGRFKGALILNDGFDGDSARSAVLADANAAVSFGRHFIGNPDLVRRLDDRLPLAPFDLKTLYTPGAKGYTDYPAITRPELVRRQVRADDLEAMKSLVSEQFSEWSNEVLVDQALINRFADLSGDDYWLHTDPERARTQSPFKTTIAHGALVQIIASRLRIPLDFEIVGFNNMVNYGSDRLRFPSPVPVGSRIRGRTRVKAVEKVKSGTQVTLEMNIHVVGNDRPSAINDLVILYM
jgi:N-ethylmaleimide reductase